ncbi:hypothetical protein D1817_05350 [Flavobacteriaceae bacterium]|nr:hypothetical protein D1817_05350 [Flavobacteriaceae bacterium]
MVTAFAFSQEKKEVDNTNTNRVSEIFSYNNQISNFLLLQQQQSNSMNASMAAFRGNSANVNATNATIIQQTGVGNVIQSNATSSNTTFQYLQNGNDNFINSINSIDNVNEAVIQNGNNNRLVNFSFGNINEANLNIIQNGNNLTFEKFGTNSITNNLQFTQQGANKTITVLSFNN